MNDDSRINNLRGIIFMLLASLSFAFNDALVKYAVKDIDSDQSLFSVVFVRGIFTSILILISIYFYAGINLSKIFYDKRSYIRGLCEVFAAFSFLTSLILMPMADVYTLLNTAPLIITATGAILLKERVGIRRWSAVILGFVGVLIVINPGNLEFGYVFILPILAAIFLTLRDVITKGYGDSSSSLEIIFITSVLVTIAFGIAALFFPFDLNYKSMLFILAASVFLTIAYLFSVLTIIYAPLSLTSSTRYSVIVFGIILGYLFFQEVPNPNMIFGAIIISLSGLFVIQREKKLGKIH
ncbi:MAG: Riboflavin transporter [Alphaproteobacteria bacterium MarineAlpha5_Bin11]|nr:transporter [Pelagibacteraceae bacterium]PPR43957.1 MAG: Riboflavin transporter [Alphaproteobacteria bacterium MarineAlpha5_Bin11]PPR50481.1 MAG: Riboflavin transporter [Alphaproteobacteria bacterium MarineAlpha5_Bin10]|tara:strand:+ start:14709 stop:15599 length:891 start_codon:yes stop_codon:yes gene_type:complete